MNLLSKIKKIKPIYLIVAIIALIIIFFITRNGNNDVAPDNAVPVKNVQTAIIEKDTYNKSAVKTVGAVNPDAKINITALTRGTVRDILFNIGDEVRAGDLLVLLSNNTTLTNVNNARTNLVNTEGNLLATKRLIEENIRQAELGVDNAEETINAAEIGLSSARTNLENTKTLKSKTNQDSKNNAVTSYNTYLNSIFDVIDNSNNILDIENEQRLPGIGSVLGVKKLSTINDANRSYYNVISKYSELKNKNINIENVTAEMRLMVDALITTKNHIDDMVSLLENSSTNSEFNEIALSTQKNIYYGLRAGFVGTITTAKALMQNLENIDLLYNSEIDALNNAVKAAENRLASSLIGLENAKITLENAKKSTDQQLLNTQAAVDNARGQLNLASSQAGDLYIKAPISGRITQKNVELGAELNPGQSVAEISQDNIMKIEISLPSEDIYQITAGQDVKIGNGLAGTIQTIAPAADPITKKVKVEITFDNMNKDLIQGTFIDVEIPVENFSFSSENSILVPIKAVIISQNESYAFGVEEGVDDNNVKVFKAKKAAIETGQTRGALIEVSSGIEPGTEIIIEGARNLADGDLIVK